MLRVLIVDVVFEFLWLIAEIVLFYTGEVVLFVLTLGRKKPRWDAYGGSDSMRAGCFSEVSIIVGLVFWLAALAGVYFIVAS